MKTNVNLFYVGRRLNNTDKLSYAYKDKDTDETLLFKKRLIGYEMIGQEVSAEREGNSFRKCTIVDHKATNKSVSEWSLKEKADMQAYELVKAAKITPDAHVDSLIDMINKSNLNYTDRKNLALYIYRAILKG